MATATNLKPNPRSDAPRKRVAASRPVPITLDQLVDRVFGSGGRAQAARGGLGARLRRVLPGRTADEAPTTEPVVHGVWGPAPTPELRQFMGLPATLNWVPSLSLAPVFAAGNPQATLCALRGAREEQAEGLRAAAAAWCDADHMRAVGLRAWVLHDLIRTFPEEQARLLDVAEATPLSLHRVLEQVPQKILTARKTSARVFEGPLSRRVDAALALLASPTIRSAVPEAPALRPRAIRLAKVAAELGGVAARVEILHRRRERLQMLTRLGARIAGRPEMSRLLRWEEERLRGAISELDERAGTLIYPEISNTPPPENVASVVSAAMGNSVVDDLYELDTRRIKEMARERDPLETGLIDRLQHLNLRVLTDLAALTDRVERGLKLGSLKSAVAPRRRAVA